MQYFLIYIFCEMEDTLVATGLSTSNKNKNS